MAEIHNSNLMKELIDGAKIQTAFDAVPHQIAEKVVPVMEVNPKLLKETNLVESVFRPTTGTSTLMTTDLNKDTYLTGATFKFSCDAASDATSIYLDCVPKGQARKRIFQTAATGVDTDDDFSLTFPPLLLERGSTILASITFTAGTNKISATVVGYTIENIKA